MLITERPRELHKPHIRPEKKIDFLTLALPVGYGGPVGLLGINIEREKAMILKKYGSKRKEKDKGAIQFLDIVNLKDGSVDIVLAEKRLTCTAEAKATMSLVNIDANKGLQRYYDIPAGLGLPLDEWGRIRMKE